MINERYKEYLEYVREYLIRNQGLNSSNPLHPFRSRYHHIIRVLHWCFRLAEGEKNLDKEALYTAAVFHDIGYADQDNEHHAKRSSAAFREYARAHHMEQEFAEKVEQMIARHSDKTLLQKGNADKALVMLLEADMLDEEGAMGIVWDCMTLGYAHANSYGNAYDHIMESSNKPEPNPMVTPKARQYWVEKKRIAAEFAEHLRDDLMIGSEYFEI